MKCATISFTKRGSNYLKLVNLFGKRHSVSRVDTRCEALWGKHSHLHVSDLWVKSITPYKKPLTLLLSVLYEVKSLSMDKTRWIGDGSKIFYQSDEKNVKKKFSLKFPEM